MKKENSYLRTPGLKKHRNHPCSHSFAVLQDNKWEFLHARASENLLFDIIPEFRSVSRRVFWEGEKKDCSLLKSIRPISIVTALYPSTYFRVACRSRVTAITF